MSTQNSESKTAAQGQNVRERAPRETTERVNEVEACLRGLEYVETLPDGSFKAINHGYDCGGGLCHIDGKRHDRLYSTENLLSGLYLAYRHSFNGLTYHPLT